MARPVRTNTVSMQVSLVDVSNLVYALNDYERRRVRKALKGKYVIDIQADRLAALFKNADVVVYKDKKV